MIALLRRLLGPRDPAPPAPPDCPRCGARTRFDVGTVDNVTCPACGFSAWVLGASPKETP